MYSGRKSDPEPLPETNYRYAVVDLASAPKLRPIVMGRLAHEAQPLFSPKLDIRVLQVGPWLVDVARVPEFELAVDEQYTDAPWGYYVATSVDIVSLRRALRRYNYVQIPGYEEPVLFRYWDPRVMGVFIDVASRLQSTVLFEFLEEIDGNTQK